MSSGELEHIRRQMLDDMASMKEADISRGLLGGSAAGGNDRAPVLPLRCQLKSFVSDYNLITRAPIDPDFASIYGPVLAARRARFLQDAHPAWAIFGRWLRSKTTVSSNTGTPGDDKAAKGVAAQVIDLAWTLRNAVEAGIFFDGLDPVADVLLPLTDRHIMVMRVLVPRPSLLWALHVRPHLNKVQAMLLRRFPLDVDQNTGYNMTEGYILCELVKHMTRDELDVYLAQLGLMIHSLDYNYEVMFDEGNTNVAVDVYQATGMMPPEHVRNVLTYALRTKCQDRSYEALGLLDTSARKRGDIKAALRKAMLDVREATLRRLCDSYTNDHDLYECQLDYLLRVIECAERSLSFVFLRRLARQMREIIGSGGETSAAERFDRIARRSLTDEQYEEVSVGMGSGEEGDDGDDGGEAGEG